MANKSKGSYLKFNLDYSTGKTEVFDIVNLSGSKIGKIKWYAPWRRYTLQTEPGIKLDTQCLMEIVNFIDFQMAQRNTKKGYEKRQH